MKKIKKIIEPKQQKDFIAEVLASPAYQERCEILFELFRLSREIGRNPKEILGFQAVLAETLIDFQTKKTEFKNEGNDIGVAVTKKLILILNRIADGVVWRMLNFDRVLIQLLSEHSKTGHLDNTAYGDFTIAQQITEKENSIVLINDLTSILRYGDLTIIGNNSISIMENKFGNSSKNNSRSNRQRKSLEGLINFLNTSTRIKEKRKDYIIKVDIPLKTYHADVASAIANAKKAGYSRTDVSDVLAIEAISTKKHDGYFPTGRPFDGVRFISRLDSISIFDKPTTRVAPYGIFPFDHRSCYELITGDTMLVATINLENLKALYNSFGLEFEIPELGEQEMRAYCDFSMAERKKFSNKTRFIVKGNGYHLSVTLDTFGILGLEFLHEEVIVKAHQELMKTIDNLGLSDKELTRFYFSFKGALVHKSRGRHNSSVCVDWLDNLVCLRHTQMRHAVESGTTN
ncbi:MAG: hypothetical protein IT310_08455 [Anaerolineales bacterium]|nr:hypothetical protein [Anaerolineales bacterium]